jgi:FXSXX-COOH protein
MSDTRVDIDAVDLTAIRLSDVTALGDTVLGHALRRLLALSPSAATDPDRANPIAAHDSYV